MVRVVGWLIMVLLFSVRLGAQAPADDERGMGKRARSSLRIMEARDLYLTGDVAGALRVYKEVVSFDSENAKAVYRIAECYLKLANYELAIQYFHKASDLDDNVHKELELLYGQALHQLGELDEALAYFQKFKEKLSVSQAKLYKIDKSIAQCNFAKKMRKNPKDLEIRNLGPSVNSGYGDFGVVLSSDGKRMYFSSRRPDTKGGKKDLHSDEKYYMDIYRSDWDESRGDWSPATNVLEGRLNSSFHDGACYLSQDGNEMYVYLNILGETKSGDIYLAKKASSGKWSKPKTLGKVINTPFWESSVTFTEDGNTMYFLSERRGGLGGSDIYVSNRISRSEWSEPENVGPVLNTKENENTLFVNPAGDTLYFSSEGHQGMGGYDIFMSVKKDGVWSGPQNLGYPINDVGDDLHFVIGPGDKAYYNTEKKGGYGELDIYEVDLSAFQFPKVGN